MSMALAQDAVSCSENVYVSCWKKKLAYVVHCTESRIMLKTGKEKLFPPIDISVSLTAVLPTFTFCQVWESCSQFF